jgi:hypothetical protein
VSRVIPFPAVAAVPDDGSFVSSSASLDEAVPASRRRHRRLIGFLATTGRLHPGGDSLAEVCASLVVLKTCDRLRPLPSPPPEPTAA